MNVLAICCEQTINHVEFQRWKFIRSVIRHFSSPGVVRLNSFRFLLSTLSASESFIFNHAISIPLLHGSFHLVFCLPRHLFPGIGANMISSACALLPYYSHVSAVILFATDATLLILSHIHFYSHSLNTSASASSYRSPLVYLLGLSLLPVSLLHRPLLILPLSCISSPSISQALKTDDDPCMSPALEYDYWFCCASELGPPRI